jgi:hypothetical protein
MVIHLAGEFAADLDGADATFEDSREHTFYGMFETAFKPFETHVGQVRAAGRLADAG